MSDFLGDIAAKNLGAAEVIQPRSPSLFEPSARLPHEPVDTTSNAGQADPAAQFEMLPDLPAPSRAPSAGPIVAWGRTLETRGDDAQPLAPVLPTGPRADVTPRVQTNSVSAQAGPAERPVAPHTQILTPSTDERARGGPLTPVEQSASRVILPPGPSRLPTEFGRVADSPVRIIERTGERPAPVQAMSLPQVGAAQASATEFEPARQAVESGQPLAPAGPLTTMMAPAIVKLAPRAALADPTPASDAPAPVIQVTIGRIEVRATPPAARSAKTASSSTPLMSLDEYLRRRAKGGGG